MHRSLTIIWLVLLTAKAVYATPPASTKFIKVDQFGYRTTAQKVAVIINPQTGFDAAIHFTPSTGANQYQVRRWSDNVVVFTGTLSVWNGGATDASSGDKAWWFNFSALTTPGDYYVYDVGKNLGSYKFTIADNVYNPVLKAAMRMFFYQRSGCTKTVANAGANWADAAALVGTNQETQARSANAPTDNTTRRDVSGGWWDAGDLNKYVTYTGKPIHQLLAAYEQNPSIWTDDYNIPESGNGIPDILDEIKWELDWLQKMQNADGSCLLKVGIRWSDYVAVTPPSADHVARYYIPGYSSAATITICANFAHAALVFQGIPALSTYANTLRTKALNAWNYFTTHPQNDGLDGGAILMAGDADKDVTWQKKMQVAAAVYLYALTSNTTYRSFVDANYTLIDAIANDWWDFWEPTLGADELLYYTTLPGATPAVVSDIKSKKKDGTLYIDYYGWNPNLDPYRSYVGSDGDDWGSNQWRADIGNINYDVYKFNIVTTGASAYKDRAEDILHYFHGVNPFSIVYLSNMYSYGATESVNEIYHSWFADGSAWDNALTSSKGGPAPGYVTGGPYSGYVDDNGACGLTPPCGQPFQKSFRQNWNTGWPDDSWSITEPDIYMQSAYVKLLSRFVSPPPMPLPLELLSFEARKLETNKNQLSWSIDNSGDVDHFIVQRSCNGTNFSDIALISNKSMQHFQFIDSGLSTLSCPTCYYRLQLTGKNGKQLYSAIKIISSNPASNLTLFPNPASSQITLRSFSMENPPVSVQWYTPDGQLLKQTSLASMECLLRIPPTTSRILFLRIQFRDHQTQTERILLDQ
jgi:endoglucanase